MRGCFGVVDLGVELVLTPLILCVDQRVDLALDIKSLGLAGVAEDLSRRACEVEVQEAPHEVVDDVGVLVHPAPQPFDRFSRHWRNSTIPRPIQHMLHCRVTK